MVACGAGKVSQMIDANCKCHLIIEDAVAEQNDRGVTVRIKFNVLAGTDPVQAGKSLTEYFQVDGEAVDKLYNVAEAVGLVTHDQRIAAAKAGQGLEINEAAMKGRQLCGEIHMEPNMRKNPATGQYEVNPEKPGPYPKIGFRTFALTDKRAADIPKDNQFLAMLNSPGAGNIAAESRRQHQPVQPGQSPAPQPVGGMSMSW